jgi:hypothetical protein
MTTDAFHSEIIKVTNTWLRKNKQKITQGPKVGTPSEFLAYERGLFLMLVQLGAAMIALVLKTRLQDKEFQKTTGDAFMKTHRKRYRHLSNFVTPVRTLFGNVVKVKTRQYVPKTDGRKRKKGRNGSGVYPALEALGIRHRVTPALASDIAWEVTEGPSMADAVKRLGRKGISIGIKTVKRVTEVIGKMALKVRDDWLESGGKDHNPLIPTGETLRGLRVLIGVDGGKYRERTNKRGRIPEGKKRHGYRTDWREPKLLVIRAIDDRGKVVRDLSPVYDGTVKGADAIFDLLKAHLQARNIQEALEIVCVCDGAVWIWERMEKMLLELGVVPARIHYAVDYFHAVEHLTAVADGKRTWSRKKRTRWLNRMKALLMDGNIEAICAELAKLARGRNARTVKREMAYFKTNMERMRYDILREKNLPIGSGATESALRQVVNMRLKGVGKFWLRENAETLLHLRCYLKAGRWDAIENAVFTNGIARR